MNEAAAPLVRDALLEWYRAGARDLPWRRSPTPYHVLLSELMLQQTRVETVIPYFERFTARWPDLASLAAASDEAVLGAWAGLGYYRRARHLLAAARAAVAAGGLPSDPERLAELPGIGPYTAGAIAAIAFGVPAAAVDGNVERVLSRVDGRAADPRSLAGRRALQARALSLSAPGVAGDVVQALMELGATVCSPRKPDCRRCPLRELCAGRASGDPEALPVKAAKKPPTPVWGVCGLLARDGRVLVGKRPDGLLGGLWEPISGDLVPGRTPAEALVQAFRSRAGVRVAPVAWLGEVEHVFTHRRLKLGVWSVRELGPGGAPDGSYDEIGMLDGNLPQLPLSRLSEKVLALSASGGLFAAGLAAEPPVSWRSETKRGVGGGDGTG
jgi:A/G-specific adenine glycosylase